VEKSQDKADFALDKYPVFTYDKSYIRQIDAVRVIKRRLCMNMKKVLLAVMLVAAVVISSAVSAQAEGSFKRFNIYTDKGASDNHYVPSGWMGDFKGLYISDGWPMNTHSGPSCIKVSYKQKGELSYKWVGVYWQNPEKNWGQMKQGGFDLTGATKLVFWIRGEKGTEVIDNIIVGGIKGTYGDSCSISVGPIDLTKEWQKIEIKLDNQDLSYVIGGFGFSVNLASNPEDFVFYLDDIYYE
jgi:opacity protein-like surface antigen